MFFIVLSSFVFIYPSSITNNKNMNLYILVDNYQSLFASLVLSNPNKVLYIPFILCSA